MPQLATIVTLDGSSNSRLRTMLLAMEWLMLYNMNLQLGWLGSDHANFHG